MEIFKLVALGIIGTVLSIILREQKKEFALFVSIVTGVLIILALYDKIGEITGVLGSMADTAGINTDYISIVLKIVGISYISEFGVQICADAGEAAIASKIELGGKILIMAVSAPILQTLLQTLVSFSL